MISPGKPFCNKVEKCLIITGGLDYMNVGFLLGDFIIFIQNHFSVTACLAPLVRF